LYNLDTTILLRMCLFTVHLF